MQLDPSDVQNVVFDLYAFVMAHPKHKMPMRYISLLIKILEIQLNGHPAVINDTLSQVTFVNLPAKGAGQ